MNILSILNDNARTSARAIAEKIGVSTGTIYSHLSKMTKKGVIRGYIPLLDHTKIGYIFTALMLIQAEGEHITDVEEILASAKEVMAVYDITGEFDIAVLAKFRQKSTLNQFIKSVLKMPHVHRTVTNMVLNVVKEDPRILV
jgi:DNA-binding Lrp family transcriptional regulator